MWHNLFEALKNPVAASWVQAAIYLITLFVLITQARILIRQTRTQEQAVRLQTEAVRQSEYLRCQIDFTESMRLLVREGLHAQIYDDLAATAGSSFAGWRTYTGAQKTTYAYLELIYELFERVFVVWQQKWIPPEEWHVWEVWLNDVVRHPLFSDVHEDNLGMYDPSFQKYVSERLQRLKADQRPGERGASASTTGNSGA